MDRRQFLASAAAAPAFPAVQTSRTRRPPNVLYLMTDQQSHSSMSANGNADLRTPAMDSLAAEGVSFHESYCAYPVCSPSRSTLMTGLMPHETAVRRNGQEIAAGIPTVGELFRAAGYHTVYGGKWHLPKGFAGMRGFEELIGGHALGSVMDEPLATACARFLAGKPKEPFLLVASFMNPHDICSWIRAHKGSREYDDTRRLPLARLNMAVDPGEPEYIQHHRTAGYDLMSQAVGIAAEWGHNDFRHYLHDYYRMVEDVDRQIGRILSALDSAGLRENTFIVFTSDHGEGLGSHRWVQKASFYEESARVPLTISGAGVSRRGARDERTLVSGLDMVPTMLDYAGIAAPANISGRSLRPAVEGYRMDRSFVVSEQSHYGTDNRQGRMLRTSRYKYIAFNGGARPEQLFDVRTDPGEVDNLARTAASRTVLDEHRRLLRDWVRETNDDFTLPS